MRLFSLLSYFSAIILMVYSIGSLESLAAFYDIPSILFVIGGLFIAVANFRLSEIFTAFRDVFSSKTNDEIKKRAELDKKIFTTMSSYTVIASVIGAIVGVIIILGNLEDIKMLGPSLALASLPVFYAILLKLLVFMPLTISIDKKSIISN